jgi:chemotaxis protein methyltransferase CheR
VTRAVVSDDEVAHLLETIFDVYHHDFRRYALASLRRRVVAALIHFHRDTVAQLEDDLRTDPRRFAELLRFLTIQVSEMFRDPSYFRAIRDVVVPYLETYPHLKIWVAGCSTGEEAYSLAIVLREAGLLERTQIYATDINVESLRTAEAGIYDLDRFAHFSESYQLAGGRGSLADHYTAAYSGALLDRSLREAILFSDHSLATDAAFAEVQLVSCRNVLIYFDKELQERALGVLGEALCRRGFLGLGAKESLLFSTHAAAFTELVADDRIYRKL